MRIMMSLLATVTGLLLLVGCGGKAPASPTKVDQRTVSPASDVMSVTKPVDPMVENRPVVSNTIDKAVSVPSVSESKQGENTDLLDSLSSETDESSSPSFEDFETPDVTSENKSKKKFTISDYKTAIKRILNEPDADLHYSLEGNCLDHSAALLERLRNEGFQSVHLAETNGNGKLINMHLKNGKVELAGKTHYFLVDRSSAVESEIIIDPTIYQFVFDKPTEALKEPIFVGNQNDLTNFYRKNINRIHHDVTDPESVNIGQYEPDELVCLIYSVNQCSINRKNLDG